MDFRILGPLEVSEQGQELPLAGSKQRAVLAILLLHANELVPSDRLIDQLWNEHPPATAAKSLQVHVSRLRQALERGNGSDGLIVTQRGGYLIRIGPDQLDRNRFERLLAEGSAALADAAPERAAELLEEALRSGTVRRWPTSPTSPSPRRRSPASTSFAWPPPRSSSMRSWRWDATRSRSAGSSCSWTPIHCASACAPS